MARVNESIAAPRLYTSYWNGAVGANAGIWDSATGMCARVILVGTVPAGGILNVTMQGGAAVSFTAAQILAAQQRLIGQFETIVAAGSTCYNLSVGF